MPGHLSAGRYLLRLSVTLPLTVALVLAVSLVPSTLRRHIQAPQHLPHAAHGADPRAGPPREAHPAAPTRGPDHEQDLSCLRCVMLLDLDARPLPVLAVRPAAAPGATVYENPRPKPLPEHAHTARGPPRTGAI